MRLRILSATVLVVPQLAWGSTVELDTAVMRATHFAQALMPKEDRQALAKSALSFWKNLDDRIPRNSPAVEEWLNKELDSADTARVGRILNSPEFALKSLSETADNCVKAFDQLVKGTDISALDELYLWTASLRCYRSPDSLLTYLKRAGLSDGRWDGPFSIQHFSFFHDAVTGPIASEIVVESHR